MGASIALECGGKGLGLRPTSFGAEATFVT